MGGGGVSPHFLTSTLDGGELLASRPSRFIAVEEPPVPIDRRLYRPRVGLDAVEKRKILPLPGIELGPPSV
jgi:hypothetical protein